MNWTQQDLERHYGMIAAPAKRPTIRLPRQRMNKWEAEYAQILENMRIVQEISWWSFESVKLRLADGCWYIPDFTVVPYVGAVQFHEVKGHWRDDALVKFKVAAEQFPWAKFMAFRRKSIREGGGWLWIR